MHLQDCDCAHSHYVPCSVHMGQQQGLIDIANRIKDRIDDSSRSVSATSKNQKTESENQHSSFRSGLFTSLVRRS